MKFTCHMIILDKAPVSTEIWCWFSQRTAVVKNLPDSIPVGKNMSFLFTTDDEPDKRSEWPRDYRLLNLQQFWEIFSDIFMICTGIFPQGVAPSVTPEVISGEFKNAVDVATWWAVMEDIPDNMLADFDHKEVDTEGKRVNPTLRYKIYYMCQVIEGAVVDLKKCGHRPNEMRVRGKFDVSGGEKKRVVEELIREKSKGDLDEFILYTIQSIQFRTMGVHHNKLAQLVRYIAFNEKEFNQLLPPCEIWRLLFSDYFDGVEDYFNRFYDKFTNECVLYFLTDYLANDYGIKMIPIYKIFTIDGQTASSKVHTLINVETIKKDILKVEAKYKLT